jgi:hypothetical protein
MFWNGVDVKINRFEKTFFTSWPIAIERKSKQRMPNHRYDDGKMKSALGSCTYADIQTYDGLAQVDHDPV